MAEQAAVTFLLEQVTEVIKGYAHLISGADKEFKKLKDDVEKLKAILQVTANISTDDEDIRLTKNGIREVVYEVEDEIDSWLTKNKDKNKVMRGVANLNFAGKVKTLREGRVKEMLEQAKEMKTALQSQGTSKEPKVHQRREDPPIRQDKVVGLKDEEDTIKGYLRTVCQELDVIPVIGMPGLGKTTLTWKIYNDEKIRYEFPIRIWVHFSQRFNSTDVLIEIMKTFTSNVDGLRTLGDRDLCDNVRECLSREKFLLVLDDVWENEHWDKIKPALPLDNGRGKVMITSRGLTVGRHVKVNTDPHQQRRLNGDESWELLQLEVFGKLDSCPDALQDIGKVIAEKCDGIPMTIVVLGGVLKDQYLSLKSYALVRNKWKEVAQNKDLELNDHMKTILEVVSLSYHRLPEYLRECFLYLGVFPAGYLVHTRTLMQLWIAEGFIQPDEKRSLEKIAVENLNDLINRNLLIVQERNPIKEVKVCRVHDIIRMFCAEEAKKQNLFKDANSSDINATVMEKVHRVCLHSDINGFFSKKLPSPLARSFLSFRKDATKVDADYVSAIFESYPKLRILESKSIKFSIFPVRLFKLHHLRYIVLCVSNLDVLPEKISQLWNLQTIIVHTNSESLKMKASLWKMIRLRQLKTKAAILLDKKPESGDKGGENLQTLNRMDPKSVPEVSQRATNLVTLGVRGKFVDRFGDMHLGKLGRLEKLKLYQTAEPDNRLQCFPDSNCFPPSLKRLTLSRTFLDWKIMSKLANIPCLEVLKLKDDAFTGISWEALDYTFNKLQVLHMLNLDLVIWSASASTFPILRHLELKNCESLTAIPDGILQNLESLDIRHVRKSIADSAKNFKLQLKLGAELIA